MALLHYKRRFVEKNFAAGASNLGALPPDPRSPYAQLARRYARAAALGTV